jgi:superfamily I DNA and RNA helicase
VETFNELSERSTRISLTKNCRNTANIIYQIQEVVNADYDVRHDAEGPPVIWTPALRDLASEAVALENFLSKTLMTYGFKPSDVTILELDPTHSPVSLLPVALQNLIQRVDVDGLVNWPFKEIGLSSVRDFKGMESNVVCVIAARGFDSIDQVRNALYVAMSRSRALLWIANTPEFDAAVKEMISE